MKRFTQFANSTHVHQDTEKLFILIALNCALRNGDAHLKNFGVVYDDVQGESTTRAGMNQHPQFAEIGQRMLQEWESGVTTSLRG